MHVKSNALLQPTLLAQSVAENFIFFTVKRKEVTDSRLFSKPAKHVIRTFKS